MTIINSRSVLVFLVGLAAFCAFGQTPISSPSAPPVLSPTVGVQGNAKMEAETVEITDFAAFPPAITRTAASGPFILHLVNKTRVTPPALQWSVASGPAALLFTITAAVNLTSFAALQRQLSVVSLPAGQYLLQTKAGKVFLTITIQ